MENIFLIHIHVNHLVTFLRIQGNIVLNRRDFMIYIMFFAGNIAGKAAHFIVHGHHIGFKAVNQVIERFQRRNPAAGGNVNIGTKGANAVIWMTFRISVYSNMAFIQMREHRFRQGAGRLAVHAGRRRRLALGDQHGNAGTLRFIVLAGDIKNLCADDFGDILKDLGQFIGIISFIDIFDISLLLFSRSVTDVIDIETERLC